MLASAKTGFSACNMPGDNVSILDLFPYNYNSSVLEAIIPMQTEICTHQVSDTSMFVARNDPQTDPVSDRDLIEMAVLISPFYTGPFALGYSLVWERNDSWSYTAAGSITR